MPPRKDLGAILVEEDVLDQKDLERIARGKDNARRPLWGVIVESDLATPEQIFRALSARFGVPVVSDERLAEVAPPEALKRALSRAEALIAGLFPVDLSADGQRATVVMVDPSDDRSTGNKPAHRCPRGGRSWPGATRSRAPSSACGARPRRW